MLEPGQLLSYLISGACLIGILWVRAAVSDLRAEIAERQEQRCAQCRQDFIGRGEFDQATRRLEMAREGAHPHG
jgi:hypothetical protein